MYPLDVVKTRVFVLISASLGVPLTSPQSTTDRSWQRRRCIQWHARLLPQDHQERGVSFSPSLLPPTPPGLQCYSRPDTNKLFSFGRLYRGIEAPILMEAPKRATKFAANDKWGQVYRNAFGIPVMNQSLSILTGASAGATEAVVIVPFELVKIRLQDKASAGKYNGMMDAVTKIVKQEGPLALYNGLESTMWRHILWNAGYFGCIFQVRSLLPKAKNNNEQMMMDMVSGATGGTIGTILNTPMDVVKSRIQNTTKVAGQVAKYNWAWPALGTILKEEGFGALYKGFTPKVLRLGPGGGILLVVYTGVMDFFRAMRDKKELSVKNV